MRLLLLAVALTQASAERPHEEEESFTLNCDDSAAIRAAAVTLEGTCQSNNAGYEWGGSFATPDNEYKWVAQARQMRERASGRVSGLVREGAE